ncbi:hypothetical protein PCYB_061040 [Plasmodium cynomolgi strain B]|uniref:Pv-fam-d protein n=1 Tax=Plasmodium cynomolgi (strain B) TaxID=1120755 RepID=K6V895_PLACD|nr:hypothetical protein PCYB_061040 [Plasmodium cynomolgi strain B]GAB65372.1 hypothetical protein PCYB_061040 [Plasmodium cynomolgi strain B]
MQPCKAFLFTFLIWAWEYTKNGALNCNGDNDGAHNQFSVRAARMLYEYDRLQNDAEGSVTSLASANSIFSRSSGGSTGSVLSRSSAGGTGSIYSKSSTKTAFGNDFEGSVGSSTSIDDLKSVASSTSTNSLDTSSERSYDDDASENQSVTDDASDNQSVTDESVTNESVTDESILVDIRDDNSVSSYNSGSTAASARTDVTNGSSSTMSGSVRSSRSSASSSTKSSRSSASGSAKSQKSKYDDTSYEDLESLEEKEAKRAKEKAQRKEILDESTYDMKTAGKYSKGYSNKYNKENRDDDNYEVSREETLNKRLKKLNSEEQEGRKDVMRSSKKGKKSRRSAKREGEFSGYLLKYKNAQRDNANFEVDQNERLFRKVREFNAKDREKMRRTLNKIKKNVKNMNVEDEDELKSQLKSLRKYINFDYDEHSSIDSGSDGSVYSDEDGSSIYVGRRGMAKNGSIERTRNNMDELRSYIDEAMDKNNAEIAHLLVNKIEKYKNKVDKLKEKNRNELKFMNLRHNLKLQKVLLYVPLISLITSVILGILLAQYWMIPVVTAYFVSLFSFAFGTFVSYGIMGKVMFNSSLKVIDYILGRNTREIADYVPHSRRVIMD